MKKVLLGLSFSVVIFSCSNSPDEKIKKNIADHVKKNMNDPSTYENLEFGDLNTFYTSFDYSKKGVRLKLEEYKLKNRANELSNKLVRNDLSLKEINLIKKEIKEVHDKQLAICDTILCESLKYKPTVTGFSLTHNFRSNNRLGAFILDKASFLIEINFQAEDKE